jgi:hypothetical protein
MMWRKISVVTLCAALLLVSTWSWEARGSEQSSAQSAFVLRSSVIGGAGTATQTGSFGQRGTLGQPTPIGVSAEPGYTLHAGFWVKGGGTVTSIGQGTPQLFTDRLYQNYPNPFNPITTIEYTVVRTSQVTITIYDVSGQHVRQLLNDSRAPGRHRAMWDGTTDRGSSVASGIYFYRLRIGTFSDVKKMVILK